MKLCDVTGGSTGMILCHVATARDSAVQRIREHMQVVAAQVQEDVTKGDFFRHLLFWKALDKGFLEYCAAVGCSRQFWCPFIISSVPSRSCSDRQACGSREVWHQGARSLLVGDCWRRGCCFSFFVGCFHVPALGDHVWNWTACWATGRLHVLGHRSKGVLASCAGCSDRGLLLQETRNTCKNCDQIKILRCQSQPLHAKWGSITKNCGKIAISRVRSLYVKASVCDSVCVCV